MRFLIILFTMISFSNADTWIPSDLDTSFSWEYSISFFENKFSHEKEIGNVKKAVAKIMSLEGVRIIDCRGGDTFVIADSFRYYSYFKVISPENEFDSAYIDTLVFDSLKVIDSVDNIGYDTGLLDYYMGNFDAYSFYNKTPYLRTASLQTKKYNGVEYFYGSYRDEGGSAMSDIFSEEYVSSNGLGLIYDKRQWGASMFEYGRSSNDVILRKVNGSSYSAGNIIKELEQTKLIENSHKDINDGSSMCNIRGDKMVLSSELKPSDIFEVQLFNVRGQKVQSLSNIDQSVYLSAGIFFVVVKMKNGDLFRGKVVMM